MLYMESLRKGSTFTFFEIIIKKAINNKHWQEHQEKKRKGKEKKRKEKKRKEKKRKEKKRKGNPHALLVGW